MPLEPPKTPAFKDSAGREWLLTLSIGLADRIRKELDVDFAHIEDGRVFVELASDPYKFAAVLWELCAGQAERKNITPEKFAEGLSGEALDAAMEAIIDATVNFIPAPTRGAARILIRKTLEAQLAAMATIETWAETNGEAMKTAATAAAIESLATFGKPSAA